MEKTETGCRTPLSGVAHLYLYLYLYLLSYFPFSGEENPDASVRAKLRL